MPSRRRVVVSLAVLSAGAAAVIIPFRLSSAAPVDRLSLEQRVGQLLMVGTPASAASATVLDQVSRYHVGGVILTGRSARGTRATADVVAQLQRKAAVPLLISADQEGGSVQVLSGPGFATIPSAVTQGGRAPATLRANARTWGDQLRAAGVRLNLAPVADTVPAGASNPPIGGFDRQYGSTPAAVGSHATAFAQGMTDAGVTPTIKHFPGLGRVPANTDTTSGVTDTVTTRTDPYLQPFRDAIRAGAPFVMMSTATYSRIDPGHPAAFSVTVLRDMLRGDLGFDGVVISDDLGNARQVSGYTPGDRATRFVGSGGDIVLTVNAAVLPAMYDALLTRARTDAAFRTRVTESAARVLAAKQRLGIETQGDFTGDGEAEPALFRPSTGGWYALGAPTVAWGVAGDVPVPADYDGDGRTDQAVVRPSTWRWYVRGANSVQLGRAGDVAVPADYTGDGRADRAVFRPSTRTWYVQGRAAVSFGAVGDLPAPGDYDGDGVAEFAVFRPSTGTWYFRSRGPVVYGQRGDVPVAADYTGDGRTDPAVFRPSTQIWYALGRAAVRYGAPGDVLVPADYTGDARTDPAVYRPSTRTWYALGRAAVRYGAAGDRAVLARGVR
jgi:beta-N-acetylhexosaminidase